MNDNLIIILGYHVGFGAQIKNTVIGFLYAEILQRSPIVLWREWCLYFDSRVHSNRSNIKANAFFDFFEPYPGFEDFELNTRENNEKSFFPEFWTGSKVMSQDRIAFHHSDQHDASISIPESFDIVLPTNHCTALGVSLH
jgi:hypothetical protein